MHEPFAVRFELIHSLYFQKKIVEQSFLFSASNTYVLINKMVIILITPMWFSV